MSKNELLEPPAPAPETAKAPVSGTPAQDSQTSHRVTPSPLPTVPPSPHPSLPLALQPLPLNALAALLGCTRSTIRHFADRFGFRYTVRRLGPRHQRIACLTPDQAQLIATELERETSSASASSSSSSPSDQGDNESTLSAPNNPSIQPSTKAAEGHFYLLQLEPRHDPGRFKLGFSSDVEARLDDLRTVVPLAKFVAAWPAQRSWERIAIVSTAQDAEPLSQEVFRTGNLAEVVAAADRFFAVMPKLAGPSADLAPRLAPASCLSRASAPPGCAADLALPQTSPGHPAAIPISPPPASTPFSSGDPPPAASPPHDHAMIFVSPVSTSHTQPESLPLTAGAPLREAPCLGAGVSLKELEMARRGEPEQPAGEARSRAEPTVYFRHLGEKSLVPCGKYSMPNPVLSPPTSEAPSERLSSGTPDDS